MSTSNPQPLPDDQIAEMFSRFRGERALITGGAGFIGSHLAHGLVRLGAQVVALDDLSGGFRENLPERNVEFVHASVLDDAALRRAARGCRWVFHQAAMVSVPESVEKPDECVRLNVGGTERVLAAAREVKAERVMFAASAAAYGNHPTLPCSESHLPDSWSPYAMSKIAGEHLLATYARCFGMSAVSLRYMNIFGPRQNPNSPYAAVISAFVNRLRAGKQPTVFGDGSQTRDFTFIENVVHANLLAAAGGRPGTVFHGQPINVGTGVRTSLLDVLNALGRALKVDATPVFGGPRAGDIQHSVADISLARSLLGYRPLVGLDEGLSRTLAEWK
jgi:UDP-glucose 4-epimerase